jgi:hypothetical protein
LPVHDFLLVAFAVAVISISQWPESGRRQWVQLRQVDGTLRQFSLPENDPRLAKLKLSLEKWARAGQETRLAIARWRTELAEFYAERTAETSHRDSPGPIRAVSFRGDSTPNSPKLTEADRLRRLEHAFWLKQADAAREAVAKIEEVRRSRRALEVPPPIVFGRLAPAGKPGYAILFSTLIGLTAGLAFAGWAYLCPAWRWSSKTGASKSPDSVLTRENSRPLQLVVPADWIRLRQPSGVRLRQAAVPLLVLAAITSILI